jgi:signal peptidase
MESKKFKLRKKPKEKREPIPKKKIFIAVFLIGFAFFGSYLIYFILQIALNTQTPMVVVVSGSMEPNINKGDLLFLKGENPEKIEVGDVIVYDAQGLWEGAPEDPIVHRVIDIDEEDGDLLFITKGDANEYKDEEPVPEDHVLGVVVGRIPYVGWIKIILTDYGLIFPVIIILSVPLVISIIWDLFKPEVEQDKEKEDKTEEFIGTIENSDKNEFIPKTEIPKEKEEGLDV